MMSGFLVFLALLQVGPSSSHQQLFGLRMCEQICRQIQGCETLSFSVFSQACPVGNIIADSGENVLLSDFKQVGSVGELKKNCQIILAIAGRKDETPAHSDQARQCNAPMKSWKVWKLLKVENVSYGSLKAITCRSYVWDNSDKESDCKGSWSVYDFLMKSSCDVSVNELPPKCSLFLSEEGGNVYIVRKLTGDEKRSIKYKPIHGKIPVMTPVEYIQTDVFDFLVSRKCNATRVDKNNSTILHWACERAHVGFVRYILSVDSVSIESRDRHGQTPVMKAVQNKHIEVIDLLVHKRCNLQAVDGYKDNILLLACRYGQVDMVKYILSKSVLSIESRGRHFDTPILRAARFGHTPVIELLISEGCDPTAVTSIKDNILHLASRCNRLDSVKYILKRNLINIDNKGYLGQSPVFSAIYNDHLKIVMYLVSKGCKLTVTDIKHDNILHVACLGGGISVVKYILSKHVVSIDSRGFKRQTPIWRATSRGHLPVVKLLVTKGCSLHKVDRTGNTVAHYACLKGHVAIVKFLLKQADISWKKKNRRGQMPIDVAESKGKTKIVDLLHARKG